MTAEEKDKKKKTTAKTATKKKAEVKDKPQKKAAKTAQKKETKKTTKVTPKTEKKEAKKETAPKKQAFERKAQTTSKKEDKKKTVKKDTDAKKKLPDGKYFSAVGRRKTSTCTVRIYEKKGGGFVVNGKEMKEYFPTFELQEKVTSPLTSLDFNDKFFVSAVVTGGGRKSQADAVRHGVGRAIVSFDETLRKQVKTSGHLTRDPRMRERKKPGLKRARRAPQWRKR